jgi:hypothetical protein
MLTVRSEIYRRPITSARTPGTETSTAMANKRQVKSDSEIRRAQMAQEMNSRSLQRQE